MTPRSVEAGELAMQWLRSEQMRLFAQHPCYRCTPWDDAAEEAEWRSKWSSIITLQLLVHERWDTIKL